MALNDTKMVSLNNAEHRRLCALVQAGGGIYVAVEEQVGNNQLVYFHDPQTRSTLALPLAGITSDQVRLHLAESRKSFTDAEPRGQEGRG